MPQQQPRHIAAVGSGHRPPQQGRALASGTPQAIRGNVPGTLTTGTAPSGPPGLSWRRGRQTRSWHACPARAGEQPIPADQEDTVIVLTLADQRQEP
ncbi:hypothetical protein AB0M19_10530 [Streptomyces sp. NPDC051920]|uniref:hypothetical protein n=1 Tax=Streptomyces sp. NPDC051920 TaxID=3155523 RepID=UPI00343B97F9